MTLIAAVTCADGFLLAADTEMSADPIVYYGRKISYYGGEKYGYRVCVAFCGSVAHGLMASEQIRDGIAQIAEPTIEKIRDLVHGVIRRINEIDLAISRQLGSEEWLSLLVGVNVGQLFRVYATTDSAIHEVETCHFGGIGSAVAHQLSNGFLLDRSATMDVSTSGAVHLIREVFRLAKSSAPAVGGRTEIMAFRVTSNSPPFRILGVEAAKLFVQMEGCYAQMRKNILGRPVWVAGKIAYRLRGKHGSGLADLVDRLEVAVNETEGADRPVLLLKEVSVDEWSAQFPD